MFTLTAWIGFISVLLVLPGLAQEPPGETTLSAEDERLIAALPVVPPGLNQAHALEIKRSKTILATYTFTVRTPDLTAEEWILVLPQPVDLPSQNILIAAGKPKCEMIADRSLLQQPLLRARVPVGADQPADAAELVVKIRAELFSRRLVSRHALAGPVKPARLTERDRKLFLRRSGEFDYDRQTFQKWVADRGLRRPQAEGEVAFARRVFQTIAANFTYEYLGAQNRRASHVCAAGKSDCGGLSVLFATVMRSQGVPARTLAGRWAQSAKPGDKVGAVAYLQEHIKAEFFANGVGWVPVDPSAAVLHDQTPGKLTYFGTDRGDFLTLHLDNDLMVDTVHFGVRTLRLMQSAAYWATGTGTVSGAESKENWEVEVLPGK
jgi:hypothetical protein